MARPNKRNVEYFPHFCLPSRSLEIVDMKFRNEGYATWFRLLERLGDAGEHCLDLSGDESWEHFITKSNLTDKKALSIFETFAKLGMIDRHLWESHKVVWCHNFVENLSPIYAKRKEVPPKRPQYFCNGNCPEIVVSVPETEFADENDTRNLVTGTRNFFPPTPPYLDKSKVKKRESKGTAVNLARPVLESSRQTGIGVLSPDGGTFQKPLRISGQEISASFLNERRRKGLSVESLLSVLYRAKDAQDIKACVIAGMSDTSIYKNFHRDEELSPGKVREWKDRLLRDGEV